MQIHMQLGIALFLRLETDFLLEQVGTRIL